MAVIRKNTREEIRITRDSYQGQEIINLRVWYLSDDGDMRPSKKGIAFRLALLPEVLAALKALVGGNTDGA